MTVRIPLRPDEGLQSAVRGVWFHALAGERWKARCGDRGLLAAELAAEIPPVLRQYAVDGGQLPDLSS